MVQTIKMTGIPGRERWNLRWALNRCELRMGRKKGGPSGEMNGFSRGEEAEMLLLSSATRNTSLTGKEGLLGAAQGETRKVC